MRPSVAAILALSAITSAFPSHTASSKSFKIGITVPGIPTHYLAPGGTALGTTDLTKAETCTINTATQLVCGADVTVGTATFNDMVALMVNPLQEITDGFSVDENNVLHWSSPALVGLDSMVKLGLKEADWALKPVDGQAGKYELWASLGCPSKTDHAFHNDMIIGSVKVVPV